MICLKMFMLIVNGWFVISYMTEFKCLKTFIFNIFRSNDEGILHLTIYYVIIQKTMSPQKSEEDVMIKFCKP